MTATNAELQRHEPQQLFHTQFSAGEPAPWPSYPADRTALGDTSLHSHDLY